MVSGGGGSCVEEVEVRKRREKSLNIIIAYTFTLNQLWKRLVQICAGNMKYTKKKNYYLLWPLEVVVIS